MKPLIYGIPTCDSIRKARKWFDANNIEYSFSDVYSFLLVELVMLLSLKVIHTHMKDLFMEELLKV